MLTDKDYATILNTEGIRGLVDAAKAEQVVEQDAHACDNCIGINPESCWFNPKARA